MVLVQADETAVPGSSAYVNANVQAMAVQAQAVQAPVVVKALAV